MMFKIVIYLREVIDFGIISDLLELIDMFFFNAL